MFSGQEELLFQRFKERLLQENASPQQTSASTPQFSIKRAEPNIALDNVSGLLSKVPPTAEFECPSIDIDFAGFFSQQAAKRDQAFCEAYMELSAVGRILACAPTGEPATDLAYAAIVKRLREITVERRKQLANSTSWPKQVKQLAIQSNYFGPELFGPDFVASFNRYLQRRALDAAVHRQHADRQQRNGGNGNRINNSEPNQPANRSNGNFGNRRRRHDNNRDAGSTNNSTPATSPPNGH